MKRRTGSKIVIGFFGLVLALPVMADGGKTGQSSRKNEPCEGTSDSKSKKLPQKAETQQSKKGTASEKAD